MATGTAGSAARDIKLPVVQSIAIQLAFNTSGATAGVKIGTIPANAVILRWTARVLTAFNAGTTNPITIGITATGAEVAASASITSATPGNYTGAPAAAGGWAKFSADQAIYTAYIPTGTAASTGAAVITVEYITTDDLNA